MNIVIWYNTKIDLNSRIATGKIRKETNKTKEQITELIRKEWGKFNKIIIKEE